MARFRSPVLSSTLTLGMAMLLELSVRASEARRLSRLAEVRVVVEL